MGMAILPYVCATAAASGTEYSSEVTASDLMATCYLLAVWDTHVARDY